MSHKEDLLRNREIFERLTGLQDGAEESAIAEEQELFTVTDDATRYESKPLDASVTASDFAVNPRKIEAYSLEHGKTVIREYGMSLSFTPPESIEFPTLSEGEASNQGNADLLESLYLRLEAEARRASQLSREEEY